MEPDPLDPLNPPADGEKDDSVEYPTGWWELIGGTWRRMTNPGTPA